MATQPTNLIDLEAQEKLRQELGGFAEAAANTVQDAVAAVASPAAQTYYEVFTEAPVAKALAVGILLGSFVTILAGKLL